MKICNDPLHFHKKMFFYIFDEIENERGLGAGVERNHVY